MIIIKTFKSILTDTVYFIVGAFIYAFAVTAVLSPNKIAPGGFTGIATSLNALINIPTGFILLILNIPVVIIGIYKIGTVFMIKTLAVTVIMSTFVEICDRLFKDLLTDRLLASLFGGVLLGIGISLVLLRGSTTGGSDIIAKLISRKYPHITIGRVILLFDVFVIILAAVVYKNLESALYSLIAMYVSSRVTDTVVYGFDKGKIAFIISDNSDSICSAISNEMKRGVTKLKITGGYKNLERTMLMCTVRRHEISALYSIIRKHDKKAFTVFATADEILGEGFKDIEKR